jgi:hypothetical protein
MNRKHLAAATSAVIAATAVAVIAPGASSQDPAVPEPFTLTMRHSEAKVTMVDLPPKMRGRDGSESPGDFVVARAPVRDAAGAKAGQLHAIFTVTGGRSPRTTETNSGTLVLPDGQLFAQGLFDNSEESMVDDMAILGGTGRYEGMTGAVRVTSGEQSVRFDVRLRR